MKIDGGCHCGFITYEAEAEPEQTTICHCTDCQTLTGSAFRTTVRVKAETFQLRSGEPKVYLKTTAESGRKIVQAFCPECGTPIYAAAAEGQPTIYGIRAGTIRQREQFVPRKQIWARSALDWVDGIADIPKTPREPE
jgi:hypothetical protein